MNILREVNRFTTVLCRFIVCILLLATLYMTLLSIMIKPEWGTVSSLLLIVILFGGYTLGFGQQIDHWFEHHIDK